MIPAFLSATKLFALSQAACLQSQNGTFLGLETWYKFLTVKYDSATDSCKIINFDPVHGSQAILGYHSPILLIGLAVIDDMLRVAGLIAVGYVVYGGIRYMVSQGNPDNAAKAQNTVIQALVGLVISIVSIGIVTFLGNRLGG